MKGFYNFNQFILKFKYFKKELIQIFLIYIN
jgi:hypothetical protein